MTQAKFVTKPSDGHGLAKIAEQLYEPTVLGEPTDAFPAIVMLQAHGASTSPLQDGHNEEVKLLVTKCEVITDAEQAGEVMLLLEALREERKGGNGQRVLPVTLLNDKKIQREKAAILIERIEAQWDRMGWTGVQGEENWRAHFGIGPNSEYSYGDRGVPGEYRKAEPAWLSQYAGSIGLFDDATNGTKEDAPPTIPLDLDGTGDDEPGDDDQQGEATAADDGEDE